MENVDKVAIDENIAAMRGGLFEVITDSLKPIVEKATDQVLAQQIAHDTRLAATLATEPVFELLRKLSLLLLDFTTRLNQTAEMIILLNAAGSSKSKPN